MFQKLQISLLLIVFKTPIIYADETIYSYKLNLNFGRQRHVTLSQKEPGRNYSLRNLLEIHFLDDSKNNNGHEYLAEKTVESCDRAICDHIERFFFEKYFESLTHLLYSFIFGAGFKTWELDLSKEFGCSRMSLESDKSKNATLHSMVSLVILKRLLKSCILTILSRLHQKQRLPLHHLLSPNY